MMIISPYGECLAISDTELDHDCEVNLEKEGYKCFRIELDNKPVTLVQLRNIDAVKAEEILPPLREELTPSAPNGPSINYALGPQYRWSAIEDEYLVRLYNENLNRHQVAAKFTSEFPKRTAKAVELRLYKLSKTGRIPAKRLSRSEASPQVEVNQEGSSMTFEINSEDLSLNARSTVIEKLQCQLVMQALQVKEQNGEITIPKRLMEHYANALLEDDEKFRLLFREKAKKLLEVIK